MAPDAATALPSPALSGHVGRYWGVRTIGAPEQRTEPSVPGTALILALEHDWWIGPAEGAPLRRIGAFAGGISLGPAVSRHEGRTHTMQVDLSPLGTAAVLGVPGAALAGEVVAFEDLVGDRVATELLERLAETNGWAARFALLEEWIARRVRDAPEPRPDVAWALRSLEATGGRLPIEELQRELRCSRRHLSSRFREAVGVGPKAYARLVRFDRAQHLLRDPTAALADVALACGFSDQAHLTREVRAFAGVTPGRMRTRAVRPDQSVPPDQAARVEGSDGAGGPPPAHDAVTSVQDPVSTPT